MQYDDHRFISNKAQRTFQIDVHLHRNSIIHILVCAVCINLIICWLLFQNVIGNHSLYTAHEIFPRISFRSRSKRTVEQLRFVDGDRHL